LSAPSSGLMVNFTLVPKMEISMRLMLLKELP
jgi:hypothetical protein